MKNLWKVALWAIALLSTLLVLWGCGGDKKEEDSDEKPGGGPHTCVGEMWVTEKEATCLAEGSKKFVCSCGKTVRTEVIPLGNHNMMNGVCVVCGSSRIEIRTVADLKNVALNLSGTYFLMNDLDLGGMEWTPVGTEESMFEGVFDGNGYVISNFKITADMECAGLFGYNNGEIKNLGMQNFTVNVAYYTSYNVYAGSLVGKNGGTITNCYAMGSVCSNNTSSGWAIAGGLVGNNGGTITNCYAIGNVSSISSGDSYAGGLVGYSYGRIGLHAIITNCYATGDVSGTSAGVSFVGGLVGYQGRSAGSARVEIIGCYATGDVSGTSSGSAMYVGSLVGRNANGEITNCYGAGNVSGTSLDSSVCVGGLVGLNEGVIKSCYAVGDISGISSGNHAFVGGLVGWNYEGSITNCYRYSGQSVTVTVKGTTTYEATNAEGTATDMATLQSVDFQQSMLGWLSDDWNFAAGMHPTLKNDGLLN